MLRAPKARANSPKGRRRPMEVSIEFSRTRAQDNAHAVVARVDHHAADLDAAAAFARSLLASLDMPQRPDAVAIYDLDGTQLYTFTFDHSSDNRPNQV
jgi:hypothetical protein